MKRGYKCLRNRIETRPVRPRCGSKPAARLSAELSCLTTPPEHRRCRCACSPVIAATCCGRWAALHPNTDAAPARLAPAVTQLYGATCCRCWPTTMNTARRWGSWCCKLIGYNIGANPTKALQAPTRSLQHHLLTGLRHLVKNEFKLNQPGAAG
jgi:hypothetical protein